MTLNIHSISDTAKLGGKIGWVQEASLSSAIQKNLKTLKKGEISKPIKISDSFIIISQYVSSLIKSKNPIFKKSKKIKFAKRKDILSMANLCIQNLEQINFFKPKEKKPIMLENLRNIFYRMELSDKEIRILSGVFASLGKKRRLTK